MSKLREIAIRRRCDDEETSAAAAAAAAGPFVTQVKCANICFSHMSNFFRKSFRSEEDHYIILHRIIKALLNIFFKKRTLLEKYSSHVIPILSPT